MTLEEKHSKSRHAPFYPLFIWSAVLLGVLGGFALGAHLVSVVAFGFAPGPSFPAMVQTHGHLQLLAWTGLFIIAVSLYKLPRLMSAKPLPRSLFPVLLLLIAGGITLKSVAQIVIYHSSRVDLLRIVVAIGSLLESVGILIFAFFIIRVLVRFKPSSSSISAVGMKPFLYLSFVGWCSYALVNALVGCLFLAGSGLVLDLTWNELAIETYIHLLLLPTCFAYSIATFPIFLRLRAPNWQVGRCAALYAAGMGLYLGSFITREFSASALKPLLLQASVFLRAGGIIWFITELDIIRLRAPWFQKFRSDRNRPHNPPREYAADYGQFGNFEWLIYTAYAWLSLAVFAELLNSISGGLFLPPSVIRHWYLLGYVTHLIFGMAVRIVPGFLGISKIAYPALVRLSFALILFATVSRTFPLVWSLRDQPIARVAYGLSGVIAMVALVCLGANLSVTVSRAKRS